jgi:hypothetical protein
MHGSGFKIVYEVLYEVRRENFLGWVNLQVMSHKILFKFFKNFIENYKSL